MKKVRFNPDVQYHYIQDPDLLYHQARIGNWGTVYLDRKRFEKRIENFNTQLAPILVRKLNSYNKQPT